MTKMPITEASGEHKTWYTEARLQTLDSLPAFMAHVLNDYEHDYGTICHALAACALGAAHAADRSEAGGITGFQSGAVMWEFIGHWMHREAQPLSLLDWENALYPQYKDQFTSISPDTLVWLRDAAKKKLAEPSEAHADVRAHWEALAAGKSPFGLRVRKD